MVPGRPAKFDDRRERVYCAFSSCGRGLLGYFFLVYQISLSISLSMEDGLM